jgi:hypothetical protein
MAIDVDPDSGDRCRSDSLESASPVHCGGQWFHPREAQASVDYQLARQAAAKARGLARPPWLAGAGWKSRCLQLLTAQAAKVDHEHIDRPETEKMILDCLQRGGILSCTCHVMQGMA